MAIVRSLQIPGALQTDILGVRVPQSLKKKSSAERACFRANRVETHEFILNVVSLETSPDRINKAGALCEQSVRRIGYHRQLDQRFPWLDNVGFSRPAEGAAGVFRPRTYVGGESFDVATLFLSQMLELSGLSTADSLLNASQDFSFCLLPKAESLEFEDEKELQRFNKEYVLSFEMRHSVGSSTPELLSPDQRFISITKLKLNPLVLWPLPIKNVDREVGPYQEILRQIWLKVSEWREQTRVLGKKSERQGGARGRSRARERKPLVALGLSLGWEEVLVIAHADDPSKLLRLDLMLRQPCLPVRVHDLSERNLGQVVSKIESALGHDLGIRAKACQALRDLREGETKRIKAGDLLDLAQRVSASLDGLVPAPQGRLPGLFAQVGWHSYPGHEKNLLKILMELREVLRGPAYSPGFDGLEAMLDFGKRNIWTPPIHLDGELGPVAGTVLTTLLEEWARNADHDPEHPAVLLADHSPDASDFFTRLRCFVGSDDDVVAVFGLDDLPAEHVRGVPHALLAGHRLRERQRPSGTGPARPRLPERVRSALRVLQLPYSLSQQILNVVNIFFWASDRETIWDESVEMLPPVLALEDYLRGLELWWKKKVEELNQLHGLMNPVFEDRFMEYYSGLSERLHGEPESQLTELTQAFRDHFYNLHSSSYSTGEMPDFDFRNRGSIRQLLRVASMIVDTLTDYLMGPQASMAVFGERSTPFVSKTCGVVVARLNAASFDTPIVLETLGHELGYLFLADAFSNLPVVGEEKNALAEIRTLKESVASSGRASTAEQISVALGLLQAEVFEQPLDSTDPTCRHFGLSSADMLEMWLFGKTFEGWLQSSTLRALLAAKASSPTLMRSELPASVKFAGAMAAPDPDHWTLRDVILRAVTVWIGLRLAELVSKENLGPDGLLDPEKFERFRDGLSGRPKGIEGGQTKGLTCESVEHVRVLLLERCIVGPVKDMGFIKSSDAWSLWVRTELIERHLPWLEDTLGATLAGFFFRSLRLHAHWPSPADWSERRIGSAGPARLWGSISNAFRELWSGCEDGSGADAEGIGDHLLPSLYVRHWLSEAEKRAVRSWLQEFDSNGEAPSPFPRAEVLGHTHPRWTADYFPTSRSKLGRPLEPPKTHVYQRGAVRPMTEEGQRVWSHANRRFLVRMLAMVPTWRRAVVYKVEKRLEQEATEKQTVEKDRTRERRG